MLFVIVKIGSHNNPLNTDNITEKDTHHLDPKSQDVLTNEAKNDLKIFESYNEIVLWSSDFHISPVADIKDIVQEYGVKVIDKSLSDHCQLTNTCQTDLKVITKENGISLGAYPNILIQRFYDFYRNDVQMASVSAFLCLHATSMCELYLPFKKPVIVIASTR